MFQDKKTGGGIMMNLVFLTSFEKKERDAVISTARLSIVEQEGEWRVLWQEQD